MRSSHDKSRGQQQVIDRKQNKVSVENMSILRPLSHLLLRFPVLQLIEFLQQGIEKGGKDVKSSFLLDRLTNLLCCARRIVAKGLLNVLLCDFPRQQHVKHVLREQIVQIKVYHAVIQHSMACHAFLGVK